MSKHLQSLTHLLHKNILWLLIGGYLVAIFWPFPGQWLAHKTFGQFTWFDHSSIKVTVPMLMLSFLLFNGGFGTQVNELITVAKRPNLLILGLLVNLLLPLLYIFCLSFLMRFWHNPLEVQNILTGLALVASMPIAGSSTAWSQNANGNLALSLGLVIASTVLSPVTTPFSLNAVGSVMTGDYAEDLQELATHGTNAFLVLSVVIPSLLGILSHFCLGETKIKQIKPTLKLLNLFNLILLSYSNAAISLPKAFAHFDLDFLLLIISLTSGLCLLAFGAGWLIVTTFHGSESEKSSLMFGLGMNNNGSGLVLSSMALADHPLVMLPIIFYNLAQQVIAGFVEAKVVKGD